MCRVSFLFCKHRSNTKDSEIKSNNNIHHVIALKSTMAKTLDKNEQSIPIVVAAEFSYMFGLPKWWHHESVFTYDTICNILSARECVCIFMSRISKSNDLFRPLHAYTLFYWIGCYAMVVVHPFLVYFFVFYSTSFSWAIIFLVKAVMWWRFFLQCSGFVSSIPYHW